MKVFISYAREDRKTALKLYHDLKKAGLNPWLDLKNLLPGQNWQRHIELAIKSSDFFIALLSNNSVSRPREFTLLFYTFFWTLIKLTTTIYSGS